MSRNAFLEGTADSGLRTAAESLPSDLVLTGPVYHIQSRGQAPDPAVILKIPIPNGAESHKTLDLYTWNGQTWEWLPGRQIRPSDMIETALDSLPAAVAVMQTNSLKPRIAVEVTPRVNLPVEGIDTLVEINPLGLVVEDNGRGMLAYGQGILGTAPAGASLDTSSTDSRRSELLVELFRA